MRIKRLTRQGNSLAYIIDRPILDMLDIDEQTLLKLEVDGRKIILEPVRQEDIERRFGQSADKVEKRFGKMFKRLAEK